MAVELARSNFGVSGRAWCSRLIRSGFAPPNRTQARVDPVDLAQPDRALVRGPALGRPAGGPFVQLHCRDGVW